MLKKIMLSSIVALLLMGCGESPEQAKINGFKLYDQAQYKEALIKLQAAFKGGVDDPELIVRLAYCVNAVKKDPTSALTMLRESAERHPDYARTYYQLGYIAFLHGEKKDNQNLVQALRFTLKAAELDPQDFKIIDNVGMFYMMSGSLDSALVWFQAAKKINPNHVELNTRIKQTEEGIRQQEIRDSILVADTLKLTS